MRSHKLSRCRGSVLCASFLALSAVAPVYAQGGQSDWILPSASDAQSQSNSADVNPGRGWMPVKHSLPSSLQAQSPQMTPMQSAQQMQQMPDVNPGGPPLGEDGSLPWQDAPRRKKSAQPAQMQAAQAADAAFRSPASGAQDAWSLPSAQQQMDLQWAQNLPSVPLSEVTPAPGHPAVRAATNSTRTGKVAKSPTTAARTQAQPGQSQLSGHVSQNANTPQATSQFDPNAGYPGTDAYNGNMPETAGMPQSGGMQMNAGMIGPYGMTAAAQQMGAMQPMNGGMQQMPMQQMPMQKMGGMQPTGAMQPDMQQMNAVMQMNGMQPMDGGMQQMPVQQMGAMQPMNGGGTQAMGAGMNPLQALMGGVMRPGDTSPFDAIGRAIAGAAAMGLIPGSNPQGVPTNPNSPNAGYTFQQGAPMQQAAPVQQTGTNGGTPIPGSQVGRQVTQSVNNNVNRGVGSMIDLGLSRIHW